MTSKQNTENERDVDDWFRLTDDEVSTLSGVIYMPANDRLAATRRAVEAILRVRGDALNRPEAEGL